MTFQFLHVALFAGLAGLAIPVIVHLWNRRQAPVIDWGAMMFLEMQPAQRRRLLLEEILLLLVRLAIVAAIVAAVAGPIVRGPAVAEWTRPPRDVVFVLDGGARMTRRDVTPSPWDRAIEQLRERIEALNIRDRYAVVVATKPVTMTSPRLQSSRTPFDFASLVSAGNTSGPTAIAQALTLFEDPNSAADREVIVLTDGVQAGWADAGALVEWDRIAAKLGERSAVIRALNIAGPLDATPANYRIDRVEQSRRVVGVGQTIDWRTRLIVDHLANAPPPIAIRLFVDGEVIRTESKVVGWDGVNGRAEVRLDHVFRKPGLHHVAIELTPPNVERDALIDDNRQDFVVDVVPEIPVLVIDGVDEFTSESPAFFLMRAFAEASDPARVSLVTPRRVSASRFQEADLDGASVVVIADVPKLEGGRAAAIERFVRAGGGALVVFGRRTVAANDLPAWMPCRPETLVRPAEAIGVGDVPSSHSAFRMFANDGKSRLAQVRFGGYWRVESDRQATIAAQFAGGEPWLIEKSLGAGSVMVSTSPFDRSWDGTLAASWEFPVLVHELIYSLANRGGTANTLAPGEALRVGPGLESPPWRDPKLPLAGAIERTGGPSRSVLVMSWPGVVDTPGPVGVYHLRLGDRRPVPVVVREDLDADLSLLSDDDRVRIERTVPIVWSDESPMIATDSMAELGRWVFVLLIGFLTLETWLAGRMTGAA